MKLAKDALACHLCIDKSELTKANYKKGSYSKTIYKVGNWFYIAKTDSQQFPKNIHKNSDAEDFVWMEIPDPYVNDKGWKIYRAAL